MKSPSSTPYLQFFGIAVVITLICTASGLYITKYLAEREALSQREKWLAQEEGKIFGPVRQRVLIMKSLIGTGRFSVDDAFEMVDKAHEAPFPEASYLMDGSGNVLRAHISSSYVPGMIRNAHEFKLSPNRLLKIYIHRRLSPPDFRRRGPPAPQGPPPGALLIGILTVGVSIVVGIGLSLIILIMYLRKRAHQVEDVMERIKSGDLKARFVIGQTDETGLLMTKFNGMADEIEKLVKNLKDTEEARTKLLQELAHDLRTPLTSIKSLQETLIGRGHQLDSEKKLQLESLMLKETAYFERLVEDLLFLSGVNDPRYGRNQRPIDLADLIDQELEYFESDNIKVHWENTRPVQILGDEHLIKRLLKNAFSNSFRYAVSSVTIDLTEEKENILLHIRNDGPQMEEAHLQHFGEKKFSRHITEESNDHISIGLGSVIMKKIMTLHNGSLAIKNVQPGVELSLQFPAKPQASA